MRRFLVLVMVLAACGGTATPIALVASSPGSIQVGEARILLGLVDPETQAFLAAPDLGASAIFTGPDATTVDVPLDFVWAIPDVRGLYRASVDLPTAGAWTVTVEADGHDPTQPAPVLVSDDTDMPQPGEPAPVVATRTTDTHELAVITSDPEPDPELYRLSLDEALTDDRPTVIVFATPAFCTSETCGPVLDGVKAMAAGHPGVDFLHIEVYENLDAQSFDDLIPVEAVETWALPSEPWVFVTDRSGVITASFEGTFEASELGNALSGMTS